MTSIQKAAQKPVAKQKADDHSRMQAGHMLTFDYLVNANQTERQIARKVVRKNLIRSAGCLTLPLTIMFFGCYVMSIRLHEDILNVFLLESGVRIRTDRMFVNANTVEELWDSLLSTDEGKFIDIFFNQQDVYGKVQAANTSEDIWGSRGLVAGYNQIQGAVRISQSRQSGQKFNKPQNCSSQLSCQLCRANIGFQSERTYIEERPREWDCGIWPNTTRRLEDEGSSAEQRRLHLVRPEMRTAFPGAAADEGDEFRIWLYPAESTDQIRERLSFYKDQNWIDNQTTRIEIRMYLMNAELGRNRLEQVTILFYFSHVGSIYYHRSLEAVFLKFWDGFMSMGADFAFFVILALTTAYRMHAAWKAFRNSTLFGHLMSLHTGWEWMLINIGWWNVFGWYRQLAWESAVMDKLTPIHVKGWTLGPTDQNLIDEFFAAATVASVGIASLRVIYAQYSVVLMFRFFVSFGTQPRLAIVLRTMSNVLMDVFHFLIVFLPTFAAYVISASLMFGRRVEGFATVQGAFGVVFRIALESEYEWGELSEQYFWAAALWAWSFMLLVVLLFLNMVVAIILDIYNETREGSFPGEAIWETMSTVILKQKKFRTWVPDATLEKFFTEEITDKATMRGEPRIQKAIITRRDLEQRFPQMPDKQMDLFFKACRIEMKWESAKDLNKKTLLRLTGIVMDALENIHGTVTRTVSEGKGQAVKNWTLPMEKKEDVITTEDQAKPTNKGPQNSMDFNKAGGPLEEVKEGDTANLAAGDDFFLAHKITTKGGKHPILTANTGQVKDTYSSCGPDWLHETWTLLRQQRQWISHANWSLEQMQWQMHKAHMAKCNQGTAASGKVL